MSNSIRDSIFAFLTTGLKTIRVASGYNYTVYDVYDPPVGIDKMAHYPSINIEDGAESASAAIGENENLLHNSLEIILNIAVQSTENPVLARCRIKADVQRYMGLNWTLGNLVLSSYYLGSSVWGIDDNKALTGLTMRYNIYYRQRLSFPQISK